jgi:hypothetical protein
MLAPWSFRRDESARRVRSRRQGDFGGVPIAFVPLIRFPFGVLACDTLLIATQIIVIANR